MAIVQNLRNDKNWTEKEKAEIIERANLIYNSKRRKTAMDREPQLKRKKKEASIDLTIEIPSSSTVISDSEMSDVENSGDESSITSSSDSSKSSESESSSDSENNK